MRKFDLTKLELGELKNLLDAADIAEQKVCTLRNRTALKEFENFYLFLDSFAAAIEREIEKRESNLTPTRK